MTFSARRLRDVDLNIANPTVTYDWHPGFELWRQKFIGVVVHNERRTKDFTSKKRVEFKQCGSLNWPI
jgi:hypothetical protein